MEIKIPGKNGNTRRSYGLRFKVNGEVVDVATTAKTGDVVAMEYLGGNVAQYPEQVAARAALVALGSVKNGRVYSEVIIP